MFFLSQQLYNNSVVSSETWPWHTLAYILHDMSYDIVRGKILTHVLYS